MPDWRSELETLLSQLHVSLDSPYGAEQPRMDAATTGNPGKASKAERKKPRRQAAPATDTESDIPWELGPLVAEDPVEDGAEVSAVRSEIEATIARVVNLAETGCIEGSLRDDVIFVLQALTRPAPRRLLPRASAKAQEEARQEWQLTSVAAVLRFCRIVLALTQALSSEAGC